MSKRVAYTIVAATVPWLAYGLYEVAGIWVMWGAVASAYLALMTYTYPFWGRK